MRKLLFCIGMSMVMSGTAFAALTWEATKGDTAADCNIVWTDDESGATFAVSLRKADLHVPPCLETKESTSTSVTLAWDANTETFLVGYKIYQGTESRTYSMCYDVGNVTEYTVTGLLPNTVYYFAATAYSIKAESHKSNEVSWQSEEEESEPKLIATDKLSVVGVDSEETVAEDGKADNAIDGDKKTTWHTKWDGDPDPPHPHEIIIDVGEVRTLCGMTCYRRTSGSNGTTKQYEISVPDGDNWAVVASGTVQDIGDDIVASWDAVESKTVRFRALSAFNDDPWTCVSEFDIYEK